jgi:MerR family copper efflux transcriptional regulator
MRIGELVRQTGVAASTLRFYESSGLLAPARRSGNGYRDYPAQTLERIGQIRLAQRLGFNLEQIRTVLGQGEGVSHGLIVQGLHTRLVEIERLQTQLNEQRQGVLSTLASLEQNWSAGSCMKLPAQD